LVEASKTVHYFWIDDTYVTGLLAQAAGMSHQDIHQYFTLHPEYLECCIKDKIHLCDYIVGPSSGDSELLLRFQRHAATCQERKCSKRSSYRALNSTCVASKKFSSLRHGHGEVKPVHMFWTSLSERTNVQSEVDAYDTFNYKKVKLKNWTLSVYFLLCMWYET
jgi:hypothetical protein